MTGLRNYPVPGETLCPACRSTSYLRRLALQNLLELPLFYNYVGDGQGILVFDASNDIYNPEPGAYLAA